MASVLEACRRGIEKFQPYLVVPVGADVSSPDYHASQSARRIIRLNQAESLAGGQRRFSFNSDSMVGRVDGCSPEAGLRVIRFNHQNNGLSDGFPF